MERLISLYWRSIGLGTVSISFARWIVTFWRKPSDFRQCLLVEVAQQYPDAGYLFFGSARSALSFYLAEMLEPGDEVIITSYTCLAVPTALIAAKVRPVYLDIDRITLAISEENLSKFFSKRTRAIVVQHTLGNVAPIDSIIMKARAIGLMVIEDCALSLGTSINEREIGSFGDAAIYSMELSKVLSCGWGGILRVNEESAYLDLRAKYTSIPEQSRLSSTKDLFQTFLCVWGTHPALLNFPGKYILWVCYTLGLFRKSTPDSEFDGVPAKDFIRKMGPAQALLGAYQWKKFRSICARCANNFKLISNSLVKAGYVVHQPPNKAVTPVSNRVSFLVQNREDLILKFRRRGIELGHWFDEPLSPTPSNPIFHYDENQFPNARQVSRSVLNVPCHSGLSKADVSKILSVIGENRLTDQ